MEKISTKLRKLVRTMPMDKLRALVRKHTKFTGVLGADRVVPPSTEPLVRKMLESIPADEPARVEALKLLLTPGVSRRLSKSVPLVSTEARMARPSILPGGLSAEKYTQLYNKRISTLSKNKHDMLKFFADRFPKFDLMPAPVVPGIATKLPAKQIKAMPKAAPVKLPYEPDKFVYRGNTNINDTVVKGPRFVTPHPDIASGYANGVIRQFPVSRLKFLAAQAKGVPVYTNHSATIDPVKILERVGASGRLAGKGSWGDRKDYEGVVERLLGGKLFIPRRAGTAVPGIRVATPASAHTNKAVQQAAWESV